MKTVSSRARCSKLTDKHVVVDIGAKSEGMLPLSEVLDHEGKPLSSQATKKSTSCDKGEAEEGDINLLASEAAAAPCMGRH